jgi:tRNA(adenine34) deaminase
MAAAFVEAEAAAARGEVPVGAAIVRDGFVIVRAGNRMIELSDPTAHAEMLALREAGRMLGEIRLADCDLYVTLEPCPMCAAAISLARIRKLTFGAYDPKSGGVDHGPRVFDHPTCHHRPEIIGGVEENKAALLLRDFFETRR